MKFISAWIRKRFRDPQTAISTISAVVGTIGVLSALAGILIVLFAH